jgi:hypothetical protein
MAGLTFDPDRELPTVCNASGCESAIELGRFWCDIHRARFLAICEAEYWAPARLSLLGIGPDDTNSLDVKNLDTKRVPVS